MIATAATVQNDMRIVVIPAKSREKIKQATKLLKVAAYCRVSTDDEEQKQFVIGLIENEIERDLAQRAAVSEAPTDSEKVAEEYTEQQETAAVSDCESVSEEVGEQPEEQESAYFSDDFDDECEETENPDEDEDLDESEDMGMSMRM